MTHGDIIAHLCQLYPPKVVHEITMETVISVIVRRMGEEALDLSAKDLERARDEVKIAIDHHRYPVNMLKLLEWFSTFI
jgi:hypothetical protein